MYGQVTTQSQVASMAMVVLSSLIPQQVNQSTSWGLDFTTGLSKRFKFMPEVSCTTVFNTTAYDTWRSAFREVVKLTISSDPDATHRIQEWLHPLTRCRVW